MFNNMWQAAINQIHLGGWVMYPLIITCFWMWYLILKKTMDMHYYTSGWRPVEQCIKNFGKDDFTCAVWQQNILGRFQTERVHDVDLDEQLLDSLRMGQEAFVKQEVSTIALLSTVAPLLGLLGTVSGMIKTFTVISQFGTGNAKALAAGISEALLTTQTGLVIAVPGLFMATYFMRKSNGLLERMRRFCMRVSWLNQGMN